MSDTNTRRLLILEWKKNHPQPKAGDFIKLLRTLGPPPEVTLAEFDPENIRCACNKTVPCDNAQVVETGEITVIEPICPPCRKDYKDQARLVCFQCCSVIGWMEPQKDVHGFKIEAGKFYHIEACAVCKKDLQKTNIIEMMLYYDDNGIPYDEDPA
jgi:hypothetical protein